MHKYGDQMTSRRVRTQRGFGIFESMVVIVFVAVVLAASLYWWSSSDRSIRVEKTVAQVEETIGIIQKIWGPRGSYTGLTEAALVGSGLLPANLVSGGQIKFDVTKGAGNVILSPQLSGGVGCNGRANCNNTIRLEMVGVDAYECQMLSRHDYGENYFGLGIGPVGGPITWHISREDSASINGICNSGSAAGYHIILNFM